MNESLNEKKSLLIVSCSFRMGSPFTCAYFSHERQHCQQNPNDKDNDCPQEVRDGESRAEPIILHNGAAVLVAHRTQLGQAQSVAVLARGVWIPTDVLSRQKQRHIVLVRVRSRVLVDVPLPLAERLQHVRRRNPLERVLVLRGERLGLLQDDQLYHRHLGKPGIEKGLRQNG